MSATPELPNPPPATASMPGEREAVPHMLVRVGARWFAIEARMVEVVAMKGAITRVPTAPRHVLGVTGLRGVLLPVVGLEQMLAVIGSSAADSAPARPRLVVVRTDEYEIALVVDETCGLIDAMPSVGSAESGAAARPAFVRGEFDWQGNRVSVLDVPRLVTAAAGRGGGDG
jgi:chemotaxis signal transduction protein